MDDRALEQAIVDILADRLGRTAASLARDMPVTDLGMDDMDAVHIANDAAAEFGIDVDFRAVRQCITVRAIIDHIKGLVNEIPIVS